MKLKYILTTTLLTGALFGITACFGDDHDHEHADHDHDHDKKEHADEKKGHEHDKKGHDHDKKEHAHEKDHDHEGHDHDHDHHAPQVAGPNGGRVLMSIKPRVEFFVTKDRKVQVTFLDDDLKAIAPGTQSVTVIAGDRSKPTTLTFAKKDNVLLSAQALPAGDDFPLVFMLKDGSAKPAVEKFTLDLSDCPTCDYLEYACTCQH